MKDGIKKLSKSKNLDDGLEYTDEVLLDTIDLSEIVNNRILDFNERMLMIEEHMRKGSTGMATAELLSFLVNFEASNNQLLSAMFRYEQEKYILAKKNAQDRIRTVVRAMGYMNEYDFRYGTRL
jgi:hypothetical protein